MFGLSQHFISNPHQKETSKPATGPLWVSLSPIRSELLSLLTTSRLAQLVPGIQAEVPVDRVADRAA